MAALLVPRLVHGKIGPFGGAERKLRVTMNGNEVLIGINRFEQRAHLVDPRFAPEQMVFVGHVPHDIWESAQTGHGIAVILHLVGTAGPRFAEWINAWVTAVEVEIDRNDDALLLRIVNGSFGFLPERNVEPGGVETRPSEIIGALGRPWIEAELELLRILDLGLVPALAAGGSTAQRYANAVDL